MAQQKYIALNVFLTFRPTAFVYYVMSASTGVEVANFNLAYLCEEDSVCIFHLLQHYACVVLSMCCAHQPLLFV